ncbi:acyl-CoA dehydrogenase family protein [Nocardioidaceae bacterium]|nr:acyl-CoA dehydrogenase family protein [Nocardioidaceae bacterium]
MTSTLPRTSESVSVDVARMRHLLDGEYAEMRDVVRGKLREHADMVQNAIHFDTPTYRRKVLEMVQQMAGEGLCSMGFPEEYGGQGDVGANVAAFETLAFGDLSVLVKFGVQFGLFGGALIQLGTEKHHERYLKPTMDGELLGCFAMSETGHGSNVQHIDTTATYDLEAREFVLNMPHEYAGKDYIGNAAEHATIAVVFAQLEVGGEGRGVHAFVVPIRDEEGEPLPGVRIADDGPKIGLNGVDNGRIWLDHVRVPRENLLDRYGQVSETGVYSSPIDNPDRRFFTMLGTLVQGRICVGGGGIYASKVALAIAVEYAHLRRQFATSDDQPEQLLIDYGLHQRRLFPLIARTYAMHFAQDRLREDFKSLFRFDADGSRDDDAEEEQRALEARAAGTKAFGTWHASHVIQECREACGGAGYLSANRLGSLRADTDVFTTFEGDNHILLQLVAKGLLTNYSTNFGELDQIGMALFVGGMAVDTVIERTALQKVVEGVRDMLTGGPTDHDVDFDEDSGVYDTAWHVNLFRYRADHTLVGAARRLKAGIDAGEDPGAVFSRCQDHVINAARAHVEKLIIEDFAAKLRETEGTPEHEALQLMCDLYALKVIEEQRAWFMEHGRLSSQRSKAVTKAVDVLCQRTRPVAQQLVDAFGVPPEMRDAEMLRQASEAENLPRPSTYTA